MRKIFVIFAAFFFLQLIAADITIYFLYMRQAEASEKMVLGRIGDDIHFQNGVWDTGEYNSDPEVPGRFRLYVFSSDGFVIDRWRPIPGYLDVSDFKHLLSYQVPTTIHTITNQNWRLYSLPISNSSGAAIGVITASYFNPTKDTQNNIDAKLLNATKTISSKLTVNNDKIDSTNLDTRDIPFDISFQIVTNYNQILIKSNTASSMDRIPNFIDPSYVAAAMKSPQIQQIHDSQSNDIYVVATRVLRDEHDTPMGVMIVGRTVREMYDLLRFFTIFQLCTGAFLLLVIFLITKLPHFKSQTAVKHVFSQKDIESIRFLKEKNALAINTTLIPLTYATNQYVLCASLFSQPKKKWEVDELLEKLGEEMGKEKWRIIYDAMAAINKKASDIMRPRLIITNKKTYQINPDLLSFLPSPR
ncbi:MAG TPA: hypothetical protein VLH19_04160 [Patescibacteria group bacterium]|nr:hypothetical protein [Patescibacteria group bacterium]